MTVLEVIQRSTEFFEKKAIESPRLQAELLLAHLLHLRRMELYLNFDRALTPAELDIFRGWVRRRGAREPVQYILGTTCFCGLEILVNPHVLIPRPETEQLAEKAWTFLTELSEKKTDAGSQQRVSAVDLGTGSGCLAMALAAHCPNSHIEALDVSSEALAVARKNIENHKLEKRIHLMQSDGLGGLQHGSAFELILSNPPYIPTRELDSLQPEVSSFEPRIALDGGPDGLNHFRRLAAEAGSFLRPNGRLMLEFGAGQTEEIRKIFELENWIVEAIQEDYNHRPRIITVRPNK